MKSKAKTLILAAIFTFLAIILISFPEAAVEGSKRGLAMWWGVVFPTLLPFFIVSEMLIGFGIVKFIGVLLEPLMRPIFRVPGSGGFAWAMGMASGFPAGAKLTARLRQEGHLTATEAERLVSFTNCSNPLFICGAVAVGFFNNPKLGILLAASHYFGNFIVGLIMRFHGKGKDEEPSKKPEWSLMGAFRVLHRTRLKDKRPFGKILGDAIFSSVQTLLMVGGFIILFSVLNKVLDLVNITAVMGMALNVVLNFFHISGILSIPLGAGLFEITLGSQLVSKAAEAHLLHQAIVTSFILAFQGFSVQAQVASILAETDIRFKPFFFARILHGFIAAILAFLLWKPLYANQSSESAGAVIPVLGEPSIVFNSVWATGLSWGPLFTIGSLIIYILLLTQKTQQNPRY